MTEGDTYDSIYYYMMYDLRIMNFGFWNLGITLGTYHFSSL